MCTCGLRLAGSPWIADTRLQEALFPQQTRVAAAARPAVASRVVARGRERKIEAELRRQLHDLRLRKREERRADAEAPPLDAGLRPEVGHPLERLEAVS